MSRLDWFWRRLIVTKLYTQGWGKADDMKRIFHLRKKLGKREICRHLVSPDHPVYIDKEVIDGNCRLLEGHFMSPLTTLLPGIMPKEVEIARFQMVLPKEWKTDLRPLCVQMGGTGDHGFGRRRKWFAKPLLQEEGIASLILENPFYGCRRPKHQFRSSLHNVSDLFVMGGCLILESLVIFNWLDKLGYGPLGASGISMGGHTACLGSTNWHKPLSLIPIMSGSTAAGVFTHMASLGATNWHKPLSLIPCMSGSTAAGTFTHGVLSTAIPWDLLMEQYMNDDTYHREIMELIESPEPYWNGKHDSMYKEGRQYFHDMEDACDSDSETKTSNHELFNNVHANQDSSEIGCNSAGQELSSFESGHSVNNQSGIRTESCDSNVKNNRSGPIREFSKADRMIRPDELIGSHTTRSWMNTLTKHIPYLSTWSKTEKNEVSKQLELDCKHFMRGVMDECTHLGNFSIPVDPELIIIVLAENDEYIPSKGYQKLHDIWPGSQLRTISTGHISGFFTGLKDFRKAVGDSFELHAIKYYNTNIRQRS